MDFEWLVLGFLGYNTGLSRGILKNIESGLKICVFEGLSGL